MTTKLFVLTAALSLATLTSAFAGMPDAYRVGAPPTPKPAAVRPYALTGRADLAPSSAQAWQQRIQRVGNKVERVQFTR